MNKELKIKAINDFNEIKAIVDAHKNDDLGVLCELLGGHNFDGDLFDLNFKSLCVTITDLPGHLSLSESVEVWDDPDGYLAFEGMIGDLKEGL